jgi:hypothetical protein
MIQASAQTTFTYLAPAGTQLKALLKLLGMLRNVSFVTTRILPSLCACLSAMASVSSVLRLFTMT